MSVEAANKYFSQYNMGDRVMVFSESTATDAITSRFTASRVLTLADTACGYATINSLPDDASGFTTIELKTNFIGTTLEGDLSCIARPIHKGRTTHVWDAEVYADQTGKQIALFRCTQMILYSR